MRSDLEAVRTHGLRVESVAGDFVVERPQVFASPQEIGPVDLVLVAWKATANAHFAEVIAPLLHAGTAILTLQNGLGNTERLAELFGAERVLGGLCFVCINRVAPGRIQHTAKGLVTVGEFAREPGARIAEIERCFTAALIECRAVPHLATAQWAKLVWNVPFNGLCIAEGGITTADLLAKPHGETEARALMREVIAGAAALGLEVPERVIEQHIVATREMGAYRPSSMIDYAEGRAVEVDAIFAEPLRRAREAGARLPHWERLLERIVGRIKERRWRGGWRA
jgi:2-dehydropantoate 2-reductase